MKFQNAQEILKKKTVKGWVAHLPDLINMINEYAPKRKPVPDHILYSKFSNDILPLHTHVRTVLDYPISASNNKRIGHNFRSGDIRWNEKDRTVEKIILNPGQPVMYQLNGSGKDGLDHNVAYTKQQLQVIKEDEIPINKELLDINKKGKKTKRKSNK